MLYYTVVCTMYLKSQKKSIFIVVYLIERRYPTREAVGETLKDMCVLHKDVFFF